MADSIAQPRFRTLALGGFAALALFLAVLGLYSVVAYTTKLRSREIGIRVALGATPQRVVAVILRGVMLPLASTAHSFAAWAAEAAISVENAAIRAALTLFRWLFITRLQVEFLALLRLSARFPMPSLSVSDSD